MITCAEKSMQTNFRKNSSIDQERREQYIEQKNQNRNARNLKKREEGSMLSRVDEVVQPGERDLFLYSCLNQSP